MYGSSNYEKYQTNFEMSGYIDYRFKVSVNKITMLLEGVENFSIQFVVHSKTN